MTWLNRLLALVLLLLGLGLVWLGGQLLLEGGSPYYLACALALIAIAGLLWRQSRKALMAYGALWSISLIWSVWESGISFWPLFGRMGLLTGIGIWLLMPWVRRSLGAKSVTPLSGGLVMLALIGVVSGLGWTFWNDRIVGGSDLSALAAAPQDARDGEWHHYGNLQAGRRFSALDQITRANVGALDEAWRFSTGPEPNGQPAPFQATPLMVDERLYFCTGYNDVIALDPETGEQLWRFAANADTTGVFGQTCRGVSYFAVPDAGEIESCAARIYTATIDSRLIALDASTGQPCADFGEAGEVDLLRGMSDAPPGYYHVSSPPTVVAGKLVIGGWVTDGQMVDEPSGVIRAFDAVTGDLAWAWDMGAPDRMGEPEEGET